jgi:hypothetical protein
MYTNTWPVRDILKLHLEYLEYTSETHRRNEARRKPRKPIGKKNASTGNDLESEKSM